MSHPGRVVRRSPRARAALQMARGAGLACLLATVPRLLPAQACLGLPSISTTRVNLSAYSGASTGAWSYGSRVGTGIGRVFFGGTVSRPKSEGASWATAYTLDLGTTLPRNLLKRMSICPTVEAWHQDGPSIPFGSAPIRSRRLGAYAGFSFGDSTDVKGFVVVPFYQAGLVQLWTDRTRRTTTISSTARGGLAAGGAAIHLNDRFILAPSFTVPIGLDGADPFLSVRASIGLFRRR